MNVNLEGTAEMSDCVVCGWPTLPLHQITLGGVKRSVCESCWNAPRRKRTHGPLICCQRGCWLGRLGRCS